MMCNAAVHDIIGQLSKNFQRKIVIIFLSISLNMCFGWEIRN